ncbi:MAG: hypothetical protein U9R40_05755 [Synergistota bacterium]|nr:hypothetical protein [Synergistota bacterium]
MKKGLFFWFSVFVTVGIIAAGVFFLGKAPEAGNPVDAIPAIDTSLPHMAMRVHENQLEAGIPERFREMAGEEGAPGVKAVEKILPLLSEARETAGVFAWQENAPHLYFCSLLGKEDIESIEKGELPAGWNADGEQVKLEPSDVAGAFKLSLEGGWDLLLRPEGKLLFAGLSAEDLDTMKQVLGGNGERFAFDWNVESEWPAHMSLFDGGMVAQALVMDGCEVGNVPLSMEMAWNNRGSEGDVRWKAKGLSDFAPEDIRNILTPVKWSGEWYLPEPGIMSMGMAMPAEIPGTTSADVVLPEWSELLNLDAETIIDTLKGPVLITMGGNSRMLMFSFPGFLMQLPGRGEAGKNLVMKLWEGDWNRFGLKPIPIPGFDVGGSSMTPLSLVAAARDDMAVAGIISPGDIGDPKPLPASVVDSGEALMWLSIDFQRAADALETIASAGAIADRVGVTENRDINVEEVVSLASELRSMGQVTLVINDLENGGGTWRKPAASTED